MTAATLKIEYASPRSLRAFDKNPRKISRSARERLKRGIQAFGLVEPLVARRRDRRVLGGHQRLAIAQDLQLKRVPVVFLDRISDDQAKALVVLLNNPAAQGTWDMARLSDLVAGLGRGFDATLTGFDPRELKRLAGWTPAAERPEPAVKKGTGRAKSKRGTVYELGPHRLCCGDATSAADMERLMDGALADLVNTDPPYGVSYRYQDGAIQGDDRTGDDLVELLRPAFALAVKYSRETAAFYIWHASASRRDFEFAMRAAGLEERQYLTWVKDAFVVLGHADYQWQTEPCFYAQRVGQRAAFHGDRTQSTVWRLEALERQPGPRAIALATGVQISNGTDQVLLTPRIPKGGRARLFRLEPGEVLTVVGDGPSDAWAIRHDRSGYAHPTQKPAELAARAIRNSTEAGQLVLDPFAGAGFTLLGAEDTGRRAFCMELDPGYVDVIRRRYAEYSGRPELAP